MEAVTINLTSNLKLQKPTSDEKYNVQTPNTNMDILDSSIKALQDKDATLTKQADFETHTSNKSNPHNVTKEQLGLSNVVNQRQIPAIQTAVTDGGVPVFDGNGYTLKDSGFSINESVPANAKFTDTVYIHPESGISMGEYSKVVVDTKGHIIGGSNPTTLAGYGITDAEPLGSSDMILTAAKDYADSTYVQSTGYTDSKVSELINGAPSTLDTLKEIADAMEENQTVVETLETAIGNKTDEAEFQAHQNSSDLHVSASEKAKWNSYEGAKADIGDIPSINNNLNTTVAGTALDAVQGKLLKEMIESHVPDIPIMTTAVNGIGKPDNKTIKVSSAGVLSTNYKSFISLYDMAQLPSPSTCDDIFKAMAQTGAHLVVAASDVSDAPDERGMIFFEKRYSDLGVAMAFTHTSAIDTHCWYRSWYRTGTTYMTDWIELQATGSGGGVEEGSTFPIMQNNNGMLWDEETNTAKFSNLLIKVRYTYNYSELKLATMIIPLDPWGDEYVSISYVIPLHHVGATALSYISIHGVMDYSGMRQISYETHIASGAQIAVTQVTAKWYL